MNTEKQYKQVIASCRELFLNKAKDYGISWIILRLPSVTDLIYIKAERVRSIQEKKVNKVGESIEGEFVAIINYCLIALMLIEIQRGDTAAEQMEEADKLAAAYDAGIEQAWSLLERKNHDYGEAWRGMRVTSITDMILMKLLRLKQIEDNQGKTIVSEGPEANYLDMLNYAVFALIKLEEQKTQDN